jgi:hypothetical protein
MCLKQAMNTLQKQGERTDDLYCVVNIRNPFDILVSTFHKDRYLFYPQYLKRGKFPASMKSDKRRRCIQTGQKAFSFKQYVWQYRHIISRMIPLQLIQGARFNYHIVFEHMQEEIDRVLYQVGVHNTHALPHRNKTPVRHADFRQYYDAETRAIVEQQIALYLEFTGYTFD